jgi:erythromycin esterase
MTRLATAFAIVASVIVCLASTSTVAATESSPAAGSVQPPVAWIRSHAIPLKTVQAGHGFRDLKPLKKVVGSARIVALGEATHGTREFFQMKHRLIEFLASKMGFTIFAMEANMPEAYRLNDYVLHGTGDPRALLKGMYFWTWNTEEVLDMIEWMREFNRSGKGRIEFTGFDMQFPDVAMQVVRRYVGEHDAAYLATMEPTWQQVSDLPRLRGLFVPAVALWRTRSQAARAVNASSSVLQHLQQLRSGHGDGSQQAGELDWAIQNARIVLQYTELMAGERTRDESMAENVKWIADHNPGAKIVLWAHNWHVGANPGSMGTHLRRMFGRQLVTLGFAFNQGSFQAMEARKGLRDITVLPAPAGTLDNALAATHIPLFVLDLRRLPQHGPVRQWFMEDHATRSIGAVFSTNYPNQSFAQTIAPATYDVLVFINTTTAARALGRPRRGIYRAGNQMGTANRRMRSLRLPRAPNF